MIQNDSQDHDRWETTGGEEDARVTNVNVTEGVNVETTIASNIHRHNRTNCSMNKSEGLGDGETNELEQNHEEENHSTFERAVQQMQQQPCSMSSSSGCSLAASSSVVDADDHYGQLGVTNSSRNKGSSNHLDILNGRTSTMILQETEEKLSKASHDVRMKHVKLNILCDRESQKGLRTKCTLTTKQLEAEENNLTLLRKTEMAHNVPDRFHEQTPVDQESEKQLGFGNLTGSKMDRVGTKMLNLENIPLQNSSNGSIRSKSNDTGERVEQSFITSSVSFMDKFVRQNMFANSTPQASAGSNTTPTSNSRDTERRFTRRRRKDIDQAMEPGGLRPGAYEAYYLSDIDIAEEPDQNHDDAQIPATLDEQNNLVQSKRRRRFLMASIAVLLIIFLVSVVAGTTLASATTKARPSQAEPAETNKCDFQGQEQPPILLQCECDKNITIVSDRTMARYTDLVNALVPSVYATLKEELDSCNSRRNIAMLHIASETGLGGTAQRVGQLQTQRYLLVFLYLSWTIMDPWVKDHGWLSSDPECRWYGVACNDEGVVTQLNFNENGLNGPFVTEVFSLLSLEALELVGNTISGTIPRDIVQLTNLTALGFGGNTKGTIPSEIGYLNELREFRIEYSFHLEGSIPSTLTKLTKLESFVIMRSSITGTVPEFFGKMTALKTLWLSDNILTGTIPSELGQCNQLQSLDLSANMLSGTLPSEFQFMHNLQFLLVYNMIHLHGKIPQGYGSLKNFTELNCVNSGIEGAPPGVCNNSLKVINCVSGPLPFECSCCECWVGLNRLLMVLERDRWSAEWESPRYEVTLNEVEDGD